MAQKAVQLRPKDMSGNWGDYDKYLEELLGHHVPSTRTLPPIYFFVTSEENVAKLTEHYKDTVNLTVNDVDA